MLPFTPDSPRAPLNTGKEVPKDLDIFFRAENDFLPEGKKLSDLSKKELAELKNKYRFSHYRPGLYQSITGFGSMLS